MKPGSIVSLMAAVGMVSAVISVGQSTSALTVSGSGRLPDTVNISDWTISPDSTRVVYLADQNADGVYELFSVPIGGGTPAVRLNTNLPTGGAIESFTVSADSSRVVYLADQNTDQLFELFSVPIGGGMPTRLNSTLPTGGAVDVYALSPDSARVVYSADQNTLGVFELFSVPIGGGASLRLSGTMVAGGDVGAFGDLIVSPDSSRVVYAADQNTDEVYELFSVPMSGGTPVRLNGNLTTGGNVFWRLMSPDGSRILYSADQITDGISELFSVPIEGGAAVRLNGNLVTGGAIDFMFGAPVVTPDSTRVVYLADQNVDDVTELFSVPIDGGLVVRLNGDLPVGGDVARFTVAPGSSNVVFVSDQTTDGVFELFSVASTGGLIVRLNSTFPTGGDIAFWVMGSSRVVYLADQDTDEIFELYSVPIGGGTPIRLNGNLVAGGDVQVDSGARITADSSRVLYRADQTVDDVFELYMVPIDGGTPVRLNANLPAGGDTFSFASSKDATWTVYVADQVTDGVIELFSAAVVPDGASVFSPVSPVRVFDSRPGSAPGPKGVIPAGGSVDVQIAGVGGVPADASAVVMNVTATESLAAGFVTVWPTGQPRPLASSLNLTAAAQTRPNLVVVPLGTGGKVTMFSQSGAQLLADVSGYFTLATGPVAAGRIVPLPPARVFDTRATEAAPGPKGFVAAGATITAQIGGVAGVPADASAVVLNITATEAGAAGFVTVWPTGQPRPTASTLNLTRPGDTTPNLVVMPLGAAGRIDLFSQSGAQLLADVTGYVTSANAPVDTTGMFVPIAPARVFDTRVGEPGAGPKGFVGAGTTVTAQVGGVAGVPSGAGLVSLNLTASEAATGFVTAFPGDVRPVASTLNLNGPDDIRPNATLTPIGPSGQLNLFSQSGANLIADVSGYTIP